MSTNPQCLPETYFSFPFYKAKEHCFGQVHNISEKVIPMRKVTMEMIANMFGCVDVEAGKLEQSTANVCGIS